MNMQACSLDPWRQKWKKMVGLESGCGMLCIYDVNACSRSMEGAKSPHFL